MKVLQGSVVKSIAGHDSGLYYVVVKAEDNAVFIANGKERKLQKPKRKNIKHISKTTTVLDIKEITNKQLRKLLLDFGGK